MSVSVDSPTAFRIRPQGPFSWDLCSDFATSWPSMRNQSARTERGVAMAFIADKTYTPVAVHLQYRDDEVHGELAGWTDAEPAIDRVAGQVARIFSLDHDATGYPEVGERDPEVGRLMAALPGLRPVNFPSPYELAYWAIMSQRVNQNTVAALKGRLMAAHGATFTIDGVTVGAIPGPEKMRTLESIPGVAAVKVDRARRMAETALTTPLLDVEHLLSLGEQAIPAARAIPGIGAFWSQGIYMRTCSVTDVWPTEPMSDAVLGALHHLGDQPTAADIARLTEAYRPWRTWVCVLMRFAAGRQLVQGISGREGRIRDAARGRG
ncbi:DNA-3-methyladenine glycosylase II [Catenulispora sp. GAS73]|uniref:DNA-3-methyladenine glycosylase family protein n=1 Tax=Catenulispora sp. GAS73 TaxID=3156269 RepID=UPI003514A84D